MIYFNENRRENYINLSTKNNLIKPLINNFKFKQEYHANLNSEYHTYDTYCFFARPGFDEKFTEESLYLFEEVPGKISKYLIEENKISLQQRRYNNLQLSLNEEWWNKYLNLKSLHEDDDYYDDRSFTTCYGEICSSEYEYVKKYPQALF